VRDAGADPIVDVVLVVRNSATRLAETVGALPGRGCRSMLVVDAGSRDESASVARDLGALVVRNSRGGYGRSCRMALARLEALPRPPDVVAFVDPLQKEDPAALPTLVDTLQNERADLVIGRGQDGAEHADRAVLGLMNLVYGRRFHAVSPFRAVRFPALVALGLSDSHEGWNVEMQVKAVRFGMNVVEVEVPERVGFTGKKSGGTGRKLFQILRHATAR
jgi:hypothetical protein